MAPPQQMGQAQTAAMREGLASPPYLQWVVLAALPWQVGIRSQWMLWAHICCGCGHHCRGLPYTGSHQHCHCLLCHFACYMSLHRCLGCHIHREKQGMCGSHRQQRSGGGSDCHSDASGCLALASSPNTGACWGGGNHPLRCKQWGGNRCRYLLRLAAPLPLVRDISV